MISMPRLHATAALYFDAARKARSIREAARRLNVASSAVNRQIIKLEAEVGAPLFERLQSGLRLTAAGEILARHVIAVLQETERARSEIDNLAGLHTGHVEVATVEGLCHDLLPNVVEQLRARAPGITVGVSVMPVSAIPEAILAGDAHIAAAFQMPRREELRAAIRCPFAVGAVLPPGHPLAGEMSVRFDACCEYPLILAKPNLSVRAQLDPLLRRSGRRAPILEASSLEMMKQLVIRGLGVAFQTRVGLERDLAAGHVVHVPLVGRRPLLSELGVYVRPNTTLPVAADLLMSLLTAEVEARHRLERTEPGG